MKQTGIMKHIFYLILPLSIVLLVVSLFSCSGPEGDFSRFSKIVREFPNTRDEWMKVAENSALKLSIHKKTAAVEVVNKETGKVWLSNPVEDDPNAAGINKDILKSQFRITYFNESSVKKMMDSYGYSVEKGQFKIEKTKTGAAVTYTLGEIDHIQLIPKVISRDRYERFYELIDDTKYTLQMDRQYQLVSLEKALSEATKNELIKKYPMVEKYDFYKLNNITNRAVLKRIEDGFIKAGYTLEDLLKDNADNFVEGEKPNIELFTITLHYDIDGGIFKVSIPTDEVLYHPTFPITTVRLFEFFGAAKAEEHEGYIFVPDGSGALINLDNGKQWADNYYSRIYDLDPSIPVKETGMKRAAVTLPVFGMKQDDDAFLAVIEDGDAHANLFADVSGKVNSYNNVCSEYSFLGFSPVTLESLQGNKYVNTYQRNPFDGEIRVAYHFLSGEEANYSGMARKYSDILFGNQKIKNKPVNLAIDFVMAIDLKKQFLGVPYNGIEVLTEYPDVINILDQLDVDGINSRVVNVLGWETGGVDHDARLKRSGKVGSKKEMNELLSFCEQNGDQLYFDGSVTRVLKNKAFDGFLRSFHTVKLLDRKDAVMYPFSVATKTVDKSLPPYYLLSPVRGEHIYKKAIKRVGDYNLPGFSFRYAGNEVHSEFFERNEVPRQNAIDYIEALFKGVSEQGANIMVRGGNSYALDNAAFITDLELSSSEYHLADKSVPFVPMVLSGKRQYAGKAINLTDYEKASLLRHIETGAVPHFIMIAEDNSVIVNTYHDDLFSVYYPVWADTIKEWASKLAEVNMAAKGTAIIRHSYLTDNVTLSEYENGAKVIVNYGKNDFTYDDVLVSGEDYTIVR